MMPHRYIILFLIIFSACSEEKIEDDLTQEYFDSGKTALKNQDITKAIESLELARHHSTDNKLGQDVKYNLAYAYYNSGLSDEALSILGELPGDYDVLWLRGACNRYLKNFDVAHNLFNETLSILESDDSKRLDIQNWIADTYIAQEAFGQAITILEGIVNADNNSHILLPALINLGFAHLENGNSNKAIEILIQAQTVGDHPMININLAEAYLKMGQENEARATVDPVLGNPDLTIRESDMAHVIDLELKGVDASYYRQKLEQPDKYAEITKIKAETGLNAAQAEIKSLNFQHDLQTRQIMLIITIGISISLISFVGYHMIRYRKEQISLSKAMRNFMDILNRPIEK
ncbi:MAG: tetratricopeptide repeat protein [Cyclobacteriaceae bacterium]